MLSNGRPWIAATFTKIQVWISKECVLINLTEITKRSLWAKCWQNFMLPPGVTAALDGNHRNDLGLSMLGPVMHRVKKGKSVMCTGMITTEYWTSLRHRTRLHQPPRSLVFILICFFLTMSINGMFSHIYTSHYANKYVIWEKLCLAATCHQVWKDFQQQLRWATKHLKPAVCHKAEKANQQIKCKHIK